MFIELIKPSENKVVLVNADHIWKIEVSYALLSSDSTVAVFVSLEEGEKNAEAIRYFKVFVGNEDFELRLHSDSKVCKVLEDIFKNAVSG